MTKNLFLLGLLMMTLLLSIRCLSANDTFRETVQNDWIRQEKTAGRKMDSLEALRDLFGRAGLLLHALEDENLITDENAARLREKIGRTESAVHEGLSPAEIQNRYLDLRWEMRNAEFENPLLKDLPIVFLKADRYIWQLIHEYLSYYPRHTNLVGGELLRLNHPGRSFETESLSLGKFPRGVFATPSLSYDAKTLYFAFADFSKLIPEDAPRLTFQAIFGRGPDRHLDEYRATPEGKYHLFKMDLATGTVEQLTDGPADDFDPALLPDGDIVFVSTRRGGFARCTDPHEPVQTATLHKLLKNGDVQTLSWHETSEWNPSVLADGRILYTRWDYVDREAARFMNLWVTNPDGTGAQVLFGNYTEKVVASLQAKQIPNSNKIMFLGSGHHIAVGGPIAILDPTREQYDPKTGEDTLDCLEILTPDIPFPETIVPGSDGKLAYVSDHYYYSPYPLSENFYLTAYSHDPNGGFLAKNNYGYYGTSGENFSAGKLGLYYRDRFGNLELIYEDPKISCRYPIPLKAREVPATITSKLPETASETGTFFLADVYESLMPSSADRPIRELRVFQILPQSGPLRDDPKLGYAFAANPRMFLGSVPVEEDGSAFFRVPARKPLYFQTVDEDGKVVRSMMSEVYLQPGENRGCVGCHEQIQTTAKNIPTKIMALSHAPSDLKPGPDGSKPMSFPILVQPVLDRACVSCHDGSEKGSSPNLRADVDEDGHFTVSYNGLKPFVRFWHWGDSLDRVTTFPGHGATDLSPLTEILDDENHGEKIGLSDEDRRLLYFWMDANSPFYGTGEEEFQKRQLQGDVIPLPELQ